MNTRHQRTLTAIRRVVVATALTGCLVVGGATAAEASSGPSTTCSSGRVCISKDWHSPGSTTTVMTRGYYFWNESAMRALGNRWYSNGGGVVAQNVVSVRNRDLHHRDACYYHWNEHIQQWTLWFTNTYAYVGWVNVGSPSMIGGYKAC